MTESYSYFFRHMAFATNAQRECAREALSAHLNEVAAYFLKVDTKNSLFLSGSLARGEPSLRLRGGRFSGLRSDLDWVVVGNGIPVGVDRHLEREFTERFPEFRDTVYRLPANRLEYLRSASTRDLRLGLLQPLVDRGTTKSLPAFSLRPIHGLEVIVYYAVAVLALENDDDEERAISGMWSRDRETAEAKLAVESLRMASLATPSHVCPATYAAVLEGACAGRFEGLAPFSMIFNLLRDRELSGEATSSVFERLGHMVCRVVGLLFEAPEIDSSGLLHLLRRNYLKSDHILHRFPLLVLAALFERKGMLKARHLRGAWADCFPALGDLAAYVVRDRWQYLKALLAAKDQGIQLDALA